MAADPTHSETPTTNERPALALGTAGHIDHGKTALVRALTGVNTDRLPQEQQRGMTIDLGFAHLDLPSCRVGIIDVPGHDRFIRNMLAGATGIDLAMLVVAADDSVKPQTREHLAILQTLGVERGVIVLTKSDRAEEEWMVLVEDEIRELVRGTFLEEAPIVRTSVVTEVGIEELRAQLDAICRDVAAAPVQERPFRLAIDRSFVLQGLGTVVTGTVSSGTVGVGETVELLPGGERLTVRTLHSHGAAADRVRRGQRAAINVPGIHHTEIRRGQVLAAPGSMRSTRRLTLAIDCHAGAMHPIRDRSAIQLHLGTDEVEAAVRLLGEPTIEPGTSGVAQVICREPVAVVGGMPVVIRMQSPRLTLGGGRVISTIASRIRRNDEESIELIRGMVGASVLERARIGVELFGFTSWRDADLALEIDVPVSDIPRLRAQLIEDGALTDLTKRIGSSTFISSRRWDHLRESIGTALERLHDAEPLAFGFERSRIRRQIRSVSDEILDAAIQSGLESGGFGGTLTVFGLADRQPRLTKKQRAMREDVLRLIGEAGVSPPSADELGRQLSADARDVATILEFCAREGTLIHVGESIYVTQETVDELRRRVNAALAVSGELTMSAFREACGTSRKYAVPFAGYLDRLGVTRRVGDVRVAATKNESSNTSSESL